MPFLIIELVFGSVALRDSTFLIKSASKAIRTETHHRGGRMVVLSGKTVLDTPSRDLVETRCRLQLAFGCVTQAFDPVMGRFDLGELTGNKLLR